MYDCVYREILIVFSDLKLNRLASDVVTELRLTGRKTPESVNKCAFLEMHSRDDLDMNSLSLGLLTFAVDHSNLSSR